MSDISPLHNSPEGRATISLFKITIATMGAASTIIEQRIRDLGLDQEQGIGVHTITSLHQDADPELVEAVEMIGVALSHAYPLLASRVAAMNVAAGEKAPDAIPDWMNPDRKE